jgi:hypothetical protein
VSAAQNNLSISDLLDLEVERETAERVLEVSKKVVQYGYFKRAQNMGIVYRPDDLTFSDFLIFSWISERKPDVRKT